MTEDNKNTNEELSEIKVPILDLPSRAEVRSILKSGKGQDGTPVHPDTRKHLRKAVIADLLAFGTEVNKANSALNKKIDSVIDNTDLSLKDLNWNYATLLSFLSTKLSMPTFISDYEAFRKQAEEDFTKAAEEIFKKQNGNNPEVPTEGEVSSSTEEPK
jgi:hypothetical protein